MKKIEELQRYEESCMEGGGVHPSSSGEYVKLSDVRAALAASGGNAAPELPEPLEINWPTLNPHALGCGVEDRGLHDRYECAEYGWEDGVDRAIECVPDEIYDADQMRAYGQACAAAAAPNAVLVSALEDAASALEGVEADRFNVDMDAVSMAASSARAALAQVKGEK